LGFKGQIIFASIWLLFGVLLIGGFFYASLNVAQEPSLPNQLPKVPNMPVCDSERALKANEASAFASFGEQIRIQFNSVTSLQGLWDGSSVEVNVTSPSSLSLPATTYSGQWNQPGVQLSSKTKQATPYLETVFNQDGFVHQWVKGTAKMSVEFPV
jgi:hypothetical protein